MHQHLTPMLSHVASGQGLHVFGDWSGCNVSVPALRHASHLRSLCLAFTKLCGLNAVGEVFHQFEPHGVTGTVLLAESHLAIHTWPEIGFVTLDVYVCNFETDNTDKAVALYSALKEYFQPREEHFSQVTRSSGARGRGIAPVYSIAATSTRPNTRHPQINSEEFPHGTA